MIYHYRLVLKSPQVKLGNDPSAFFYDLGYRECLRAPLDSLAPEPKRSS